MGSGVVAMVLIHVAALYITSPEDIADALLLVSPTPFALYGVIGLVGVVPTAFVSLARTCLPAGLWRVAHVGLTVVIVVASVVHAVQIEGVMGRSLQVGFMRLRAGRQGIERRESRADAHAVADEGRRWTVTDRSG